MIVDVLRCSDQERDLVYMHCINDQDDLLIIVMYMLGTGKLFGCTQVLCFLTIFPFRPGILVPKMVCIILTSLDVVGLFLSWFFCTIFSSCQ